MVMIVFHRVIKKAKHQSRKPTAMLLDNSFNSSIVSDIWKLVNFASIQKKGHKTLSVDYRPISFTSVVGKLMETIIRDILMSVLKKYSD